MVNDVGVMIDPKARQGRIAQRGKQGLEYWLQGIAELIGEPASQEIPLIEIVLGGVEKSPDVLPGPEGEQG